MPDARSIVIIGPAHPLRGGLASFNERLARAFQDQGQKVRVYTFSLQYPDFLFPGTTQFSSEPPPQDLDIRVQVNSINPFNWIQIGRALKKFRPDIIIVRYWLPFMGPCLGTILRFVQKNHHTKVICIADNILPHEQRPGDRAFTKYFIRPVDGFVTMSRKVLSDLRQFTSTKPAGFVAHPLYDNFGSALPQSEARAQLNLPASGKIILFFGFIRPYKGLDILLRAMAESPLRDAGIRLLVAGEFYDTSKPYLDLIRELQLTEKVILRTEFIPDSQVRYYLCAADLVVQPYRNATQSGVTPLAYHFEKPMVVTRVGALPDMVPEGRVGLVCDPEPKSLSETIVRFFSLNQEDFLQGIREEKKLYTWQKLVDTITQMADDIQK